MNTADLQGILTFLESAERLKCTHRSAWTSDGGQESVAEHTWRLCLMALVLSDYFPEVDVARLVRMLIIHDLGEALHGDIPAPAQEADESKATRERADLETLLAPLPLQQRKEIASLWDEYEEASTPEACLAKGLDKLETILQHNQGMNPDDFDYRFNLEYGLRFTEADPRLAAIRTVLDAETERRAQASREA
jgi:putative hydrolase of HD superfamily